MSCILSKSRTSALLDIMLEISIVFGFIEVHTDVSRYCDDTFSRHKDNCDLGM